MIAFTGDMNASTRADDSITSSRATLDLLDGIKNKEYVFWVDGNTGPYAIQSYGGVQTGALTEVGEILQNKGCKVLILPYAITRGDDRVWISPEMSENGFEQLSSSSDEESSLVGGEIDRKVEQFRRQARASFQILDGNKEVKILLIHVPKQISLTVEELKRYGAPLDYDLIMARHYHGGQWRLPLVGALPVQPDPPLSSQSRALCKSNVLLGA